MKYWIGCACLLVAGLAMAEPLPRGDTKKIDKGKIKGPAKIVEVAGSCHDDLAYQLVENGYFTSDSKEFYLLATVGQLKGKGKGNKKKRKLMRYALQAIDLTNLQMTTKLSLTHRRNASLITFGEPVEGVQAIAFAGKEAPCGEGKATIIGISFKENSKAVRDKGDFQIVPGRRGRVLVDREKWRLTETDLTTFQTRFLTAVPKDETLLLYDSQRKHLVTYVEDKKRRGLINYRVLASKLEEEQKLAIAKNDRVIRAGPWFGFVTVDIGAQTALVKQVPIWTGKEKIVRTKLKFPAGVRGSDTLFAANFTADLIAVTAKTDSVSKNWGAVYLYDLKDGSLVAEIKAGGRGYFGYIGFDPAGRYLFAEVKENNLTRSLKVYEVAKKIEQEFEM